MIVYLDTSVILRVLLRQPDPVLSWGRWQEAHSSRLWRTEALRTVDRLRQANELTDQELLALRQNIAIVDAALHIAALNDAVLQRVEEGFPTTVGTLDGIHLATALLIRQQGRVDRFLTHDAQLGRAAAGLGFVVEGSPQMDVH